MAYAVLAGAILFEAGAIAEAINWNKGATAQGMRGFVFVVGGMFFVISSVNFFASQRQRGR